MTRYRYTARQHDGRQTAGQIDAPDQTEARRLLSARQLEVLSLEEADTAGGSGRARTLNLREAIELAQQVAWLASAELPLAEGLGAAAEQSQSRSLARAMRCLADRIERGMALDEALAGPPPLVPPGVAGLVAAASKTDQLGEALADWTDHYGHLSQIRRELSGALNYPLLVLGLAAAVFVMLVAYVGGIFEQMFLEFELTLPRATQLLIWLRHTGGWLVAAAVVLVGCVGCIVRLVWGRAVWWRVLSAVPVVGTPWRWLALTEWAGLLRLLLRNQIPLPDALQLVAGAMNQLQLQQWTLQLARACQRGRPLWRTMQSQPGMPAQVGLLVRWGEESGSLPNALATVQRVLQRQIYLRTLWLKSLAPPVVFILIGVMVIYVVVALFAPLLDMVQSLSG